MKIKRYIAPSMREALKQVRTEQGPDAVILSSRRIEEGMEVIAAVDYDQDLFVEASRARAPGQTAVPAAPVEIAAPPPATTAVAPASPARPPTPVPPPAVAAAPRATRLPTALGEPVGITLMRRELKDLRLLMEGELAQLSWHDQRVRDPLRARVLEDLASMDLAPDVALALATAAPRKTGLEDPSHIPLALLLRHLPVVERLGTVIGGVIAVVGPTGAGKTTTIAKLAARFCLKHGAEGLALVSTDGYRVGALEQLKTYARMLGAEFHAAEGGRDLGRTLERLRGRRLVLIDTAGMAPHDARLTEQLARLALQAVRARVLLALPAHAELHALEDIVNGFAQVAPAACVLTKVDEAASLGAALSVILRKRLRIAYVSDGQRVPEDLHSAHQRRIWLVRRALKVKERAAARNPAHLARAFGREQLHA